MSWMGATLVSALFLGMYDLCIKHAIRDNAVLPVLFFSTVTGATVWSALLLLQVAHPGLLPAALVADHLTAGQHLQLLLKSAIVASSWLFTYFGLKHLPLSLALPVRATSPLGTLAGALLILGERPNGLELLGVAMTLASFVGLSFAVRQEGFYFHRDKWIGFLIGGTVPGGTSSLYDKIPAGPRASHGADGAGVVFHLSGAAVHAIHHRMEVALVGAQRISLALEHSGHRVVAAGGGLHLFWRVASARRFGVRGHEFAVW